MTHSNSWLSTDTSREALFDELVKIGEKAEKDSKGLKNALKHGLAGAAGVGTGMAAGYGTMHVLEKGFPGVFTPKKPVHISKLKRHILTKGLPIGAGLSATLWSRYRKKMQNKLQGTKAPDGGR